MTPITKDGFIEMREAFQARKAELEEAARPLREQRDQLRAQLAPLEEQMRELTRQIFEVEGGKTGNELYECAQSIAMLSRALGAKSVKAESPTT